MENKKLTPRESEVLTLMKQGYENKEIAKLLGISVKTVEKHVSKILHKMEFQSARKLLASFITA